MPTYGECDFCQGTMDNCPYCKRPIGTIKDISGKSITPKQLEEMFEDEK